ncbi:MAG: Gfo/Idh/MocA family oxidoreductase [Bacteroidetes bacterium]|nr:Gfo/Idh/MocA family oxidoreductase [Bacteroidota bacterium]
MTLGLFGSGRAADARRASLERLGYAVAWHADEVMDWDEAPAQRPALDALFVAGSTADRAFAVRMALRHGVPVLAEWPPAASHRELDALLAIAEESGVTLAVARTLSHLPALDATPTDARLIAVRRTVAAPRALVAALPDVLDVVMRLTGTSTLRRLNPTVVRDAESRPTAIGLSIRLVGDAHALVTLAHAEASTFTVEAFGSTSGPFAASLRPDAAHRNDALDRETVAFLEGLSGPPDPSSASAARVLLRLSERVAARLR